ncbi:MAG: M3 family peptidase, partial [Planctomycetes bacterium]|nr:M3 family peptidase [Planctomycetota bacterium]
MSAPGADADGNPLFAHERLPAFDRIRVEHMEPAMRRLLPRMITDLEALEASATTLAPTWDSVMVPLNDLSEPVRFAWGVINHLKSVQDSPALRTAREAVQGDVVQAFLRIGQSQPIYRAMKALRDGGEWANLSPTQRRIVDAAIRDAELSGVGLTGDALARFQA